jgi:glycosyltransferase involved in cell wall biosynthesis
MLRPSIIIPVFNRPDCLRRALTSVQRQTCPYLECLIIDDNSTTDIRSVVDEFKDSRFRYLRRDHKGGPYAARVTGYQEVQGDFICNLDSDDEFFPWALDQARRHLEDTPSVDGVIGLRLRSYDSRLLVRVRGVERYVTPRDACTESLIPDRVGAVRRIVVEEWLQKRNDYFAFEIHQWLTYALHHDQLYVDEPWIRCHMDAPDRVSNQMPSSQRLDDFVKFLGEHRSYVETQESVSLDEIVIMAYVALKRARRPEAALAADALKARGLSRSGAFVRQLEQKVKRKLRPRSNDAIRWL